MYNLLSRKNDITSISWLFVWITLSYYFLQDYNFSYYDIYLTILAIYLADLNGGLTHIYLDNSKIKNNNTLTDNFKKEFQDHHENSILQFENDINYRSYHEMNLVYPFASIAFIFCLILPIYFRYFILIFSYLHVFQQITHYWCHARTNNKPMMFIGKILQGISVKQYNSLTKNYYLSKILSIYKFNLVLNPNDHRKHHIHPQHAINFCILTGWANPLLNYLVLKYDLLNPSGKFITKIDKIEKKFFY